MALLYCFIINTVKALNSITHMLICEFILNIFVFSFISNLNYSKCNSDNTIIHLIIVILIINKIIPKENMCNIEKKVKH